MSTNTNINITVVTTVDPIVHVVKQILLSSNSSAFSIICESHDITVKSVSDAIESIISEMTDSCKTIFIFNNISELFSCTKYSEECNSNRIWSTYIITDKQQLNESNAIMSIPYFGDWSKLHKILGNIIVVKTKEKGKDRSELITPKLSFIKQ